MEQQRPVCRPGRFGPALAAVLALVVTVSGGARPAAASSSGIDKISVYAGTWASRIVHYQTPYSKARVEAFTVRNDCWRSASYYACDQFVSGRSAAFIVYVYNAGQHLYHLSVIAKDGGPAASGVLKIDGNTWTFPWQFQDKGKTVYVRIINQFPNPNQIEFHEGFSYDNVHWTPSADGVEHRAPAR